MAGPTHQSLGDMNYLQYVLCNWHSYALLTCFTFDSLVDGKNLKTKIVKIRDPWGKIKWPDFKKISKIGKKLLDFQKWNQIIKQYERKLDHKNCKMWDDGCIYLLFEDFYENFSEITISHYHKDKILSQYNTHLCLNPMRYLEIKFPKEIEKMDKKSKKKVTIIVSHKDPRHPDVNNDPPFINAKLIFIPFKSINNAHIDKNTEILDFMSEGKSEKYFNLFQVKNSTHAFNPQLICGQDGSLRDTLLDFNLDTFYETKDPNMIKNGSFLLIIKSNEPDSHYELSTYSRLPCRIFETFDPDKQILDTALIQSYLQKVDIEVQANNIEWIKENGVDYGLKAFDSGFGFGIFKNCSGRYLDLSLKLSGTGLEVVYPPEAVQDRSKLTTFQLEMLNSKEILVQVTKGIKHGSYEVIIFETRSRSINASLSFCRM